MKPKHLVKIPRMIKVGGWDYKVRMNKSASRECQENAASGATVWRSRRIDIDVTRDPLCVSETFLHESLHASDEVYQKSKLNEDEVSALSQGLLQIFEQCGVRFVP